MWEGPQTLVVECIDTRNVTVQVMPLVLAWHEAESWPVIGTSCHRMSQKSTWVLRSPVDKCTAPLLLEDVASQRRQRLQ